MQEMRYLLITSFLLVLVGAPAVYSVVREPQRMQAAQESPAKGETAPDRSPAGLAQDPSPRAAIKSKSVILDYACKGPDESYEVEGTLVRLKGTSCIDEKWKNVSIVNQTNGFTASVILLKNKRFTTDFIDLQEGENKLSLQATDENGRAIVQNFLVKCRFPASSGLSEN